MKRMHWICSMLCTALLLSAGSAWSQEGTPVLTRGPGFGEGVELLGFGGLRGKVVRGAPFSAMAVSESTQTLADGTHISHKTATTVYRDGEGRVRKEVNLSAIGPFATARGHSFVVISDPVAGTEYVLEPDHKIARKALVTASFHESGPKTEINAKMEALGAQPAGRPRGAIVPREWQGKAEGDAKTESLGTQSVNGISTVGTRTTHTIAAGEIGNDQPIKVVSERWYSPDLQIVVMSKRSDPRFGDTTYTLTNIQRQEPGAAFFAIPTDYTVEEGKPGMQMRGFDRVAPPAPPGAPPLGE
ncbi:MAG TPA: hypothetical protein VOA41_17205 [Candidatus Dormibacteraeota bacterium]|nr:hypothetical protein [Candidatus Dormibacteraeota bacterium]